MAKAFLSLGTNRGDKRSNMKTVAALLNEKAGTILVFSTLLETEPWGFTSENRFLNAAALLETRLTPFELLAITQQIEKEMGREEKSVGVYKDRIIDIDILFYDDLILQTPTLTLPHPMLHLREFVLQPLAEIAPHFQHPVLLKTVSDLLNTIKNTKNG